MEASAGAEVLNRVRDLLPTLREQAQETEDRRALSADTVKSLAETGFFRLLQPARFGGYEAEPLTFLRGVREIAAACGSTGWVASVVGVHNWQLALFPDQAQQDVWGDDPSTRMSSSYAPTGKIKAVEGGYRVSGRWSFSSGCEHATWVLLGGIVPPGEDGAQADFRTFLIPAADYAIEDVWHTVGLRGTGSNDIVVRDAFVPTYRSLSFNDTARCKCPGQELNTSPIYRIPYGSLFPCAITTPIIGMAIGAYDAHVGYTRERVRASYVGVRAAEDPHSQVRVAVAASDLDSAWLAIETDFRELMGHAAAGEKLPMRLRLRVRRDQVRGTGLAITAVDRLFENSGGRAIYLTSPIQRFWRDAHAGRAHAINDPERALTMFGKGEFGLSVADAMV
jgi:3-hydroxy-9,10-secoandrosta-1,3,5(10)-triene-9,17-dione monooxygenase